MERSILRTGILVGASGILLGLLLGWWVTERVTRPVERLAAGARSISNGDWSVRVEARAGDELGDLARAFNQMTEQLIAQRDRAIQAERVAAWRELARRLAHELKNPLFPLQITVENLQRARALDPKQYSRMTIFRESTETLLAELAQLKTIVGRFSDFARMPPPVLNPVSVNEIVSSVMKLFEAQMNSMTARATLKLARNSDPRRSAASPADSEQLGRALRNLVLNAMDAMPQGGALYVRTSVSETGVRIEVSDLQRGQGLTAEECEQLSPRLTTPTKAAWRRAWALAIVQSVVSDHHGRISVTSEPGRGAELRSGSAIVHRYPRMSRLLIVDDDPNTLASLARAFRMAGHQAEVADNPARALALIREQPFDLIFSDVVMPGKDGIALLEEIRALGVSTPVVMMSGQATVDMAVRATRLGALDFLEKPISTDKLLLTVENAARLVRLETENRELRKRVGRHEIVWASDAMRRVMAQVERVAAGESRVCILGETGTGKELIARAVHERSPRRNGPFVTLNCAAVPQELIESELFGHEKGAFTGAATRHAGKFEQADRGTLFLDEIGDMPPVMQAKLLRVLEEGEIERVGGERPMRVDVRVVVATHRNLEEQVRSGVFRQDLYHRIFVFPILLPPLRERPGDLPVLVEHFAHRVSEQNGWKPKAFTREAVKALAGYAWPGNIRELRNSVERLLLLADAEVDLETVRLVLPDSQAAGPRSVFSGTLAARVEGFEKETILAELKQHAYNMAETARALGLERSHLYKKCAQLGIEVDKLRSAAL